MDDCKDITTHQSIKDILSELNSIDNANDEEVEKIICKFKEFYDTESRHLYSEVSAFLYSIKEDDLEYTYQNIDKVKSCFKEYDKENNSNYSNQILKLEDHIRLEIARFEYLKRVQAESTENIKAESLKLEEKIKESEKKLNELDKNIKKSKYKYDTLKKSIDNLNSQIISVIGIFSAIVITFFGGINFLESVMNSIGKVSKYRFVFAVFLTGFVMFNTIFMLINFIAKLTDKNIRTECKYQNEEVNCRQCKKWILICVKTKHPTVFWVNILFILGMIGITILYIIVWILKVKYNIVF